MHKRFLIKIQYVSITIFRRVLACHDYIIEFHKPVEQSNFIGLLDKNRQTKLEKINYFKIYMIDRLIKYPTVICFYVERERERE